MMFKKMNVYSCLLICFKHDQKSQRQSLEWDELVLLFIRMSNLKIQFLFNSANLDKENLEIPVVVNEAGKSNVFVMISLLLYF